MKRPVFSQLDRLADYGADEWAWTHRRGKPARVRLPVRRGVDQLIREDGRVSVEGDADADA